MKTNMLNWKTLFMGIWMAGTFAACNGNSGSNQDTEGRTAAVDGVAEPVPTPPPGDVQEITEDVNGGGSLLPEYMDVKNALVQDDFEKAKEEAKELQEQVNSMEAGNLNEQQKQEIQTSINGLANANDIQSQRQSFANLSKQLYSLAHGNDLTNKMLYWQHCPMAMNNQGANWLSYEKEIQNPFMGQEMPKCGSVQETLNN